MTKQQNLIESTAVLVLVSIMVLIGNHVGFNNNIVEALPGMGILLLICGCGCSHQHVRIQENPVCSFRHHLRCYCQPAGFSSVRNY